MDYTIDTNIWIYLLEGRAENSDLKIKIKDQQVSPVLTPMRLPSGVDVMLTSPVI